MTEDRTDDRNISRRDFLQTSGAIAATAALAGCATAKSEAPAAAKAAETAVEKPKAPAFIRKIGPSDTINIGYIGVGVRGKQHMRYCGFANPKDRQEDKEATKNLPRPLNVRAVAMSDCYEGNRQWAREAVSGIKVYPDFHELLADKEVDAIFIGTSDHNHAPIGIAACEAGKHIYSEKCFANTFEDSVAYRDAIKRAGIVFQLGHQTRSGSAMEEAKKAMGSIGPDGALGKVTLIETYTNRNDPNGAWLYRIPSNLKREEVDWERFTGNGPKREFNPDRFFRFRKYWDYGTGHAGDLVTHEMDAIQQITGLGIPDTCVATGGIYYYKSPIDQGRETPDVFQCSYNYETEGLIVNYTGTLANSRPRERTIYGTDATLDMSRGIKVYLDKNSDKYAALIKDKKYELPVAEEYNKQHEKLYGLSTDTNDWTIGKAIYLDVLGDKVVNVTGLHVLNFVECVRAGNLKTNCNVDMAFEEAVIAHMATQSFHRGCRVRWDAKREKIVNDKV